MGVRWSLYAICAYARHRIQRRSSNKSTSPPGTSSAGLSRRGCSREPAPPRRRWLRQVDRPGKLPSFRVSVAAPTGYTGISGAAEYGGGASGRLALSHQFFPSDNSVSAMVDFVRRAQAVTREAAAIAGTRPRALTEGLS